MPARQPWGACVPAIMIIVIRHPPRSDHAPAEAIGQSRADQRAGNRKIRLEGEMIAP
jgi:hypothetical protein